MNLTDTLNLAWAAFEREEYVGSERTFRDLLAMPALTISERQQARFGLGYALAFLQQFEEARNLFDPLRPEARAGGDPGAEHRALHQVGMVERLAGNWGAAQDCFERERDLIAHLGNGDLAVAINAYELGLTSLKLGQTEQAKAWPDLSLNRAERTDDLIAVGCAHRGLGDWYERSGQQKETRACWRAARASFLAAGNEKATSDVERRLYPDS